MIALFGGTFNPVHNGHIDLARQVAREFDLNSVQFVPSYLPVHRDEPKVDAQLRKQMVELAIQPYPELCLNDCEIKRSGYSYSVDTLELIQQQHPGESLCWLMGVDAFNGFASWRNPQGILQRANIIVCARPGIELQPSRFSNHYLGEQESLHQFRAGKIAFFAMQPNSCSSTDIRKRIKAGESVTRCLSQAVLEFIQQNNLYEN